MFTNLLCQSVLRVKAKDNNRTPYGCLGSFPYGQVVTQLVRGGVWGTLLPVDPSVSIGIDHEFLLTFPTARCWPSGEFCLTSSDTLVSDHRHCHSDDHIIVACGVCVRCIESCVCCIESRVRGCESQTHLTPLKALLNSSPCSRDAPGPSPGATLRVSRVLSEFHEGQISALSSALSRGARDRTGQRRPRRLTEGPGSLLGAS